MLRSQRFSLSGVTDCPRGNRSRPYELRCRITSDVVQVFGRRHDEAIHALRRPASEKRQCTKSREYGTRQCSEWLWGSYVGGDLDGGRGASRMLAQLSRFGMNVAQGDF
jgi:hypothetical protein